MQIPTRGEQREPLAAGFRRFAAELWFFSHDLPRQSSVIRSWFSERNCGTIISHAVADLLPAGRKFKKSAEKADAASQGRLYSAAGRRFIYEPSSDAEPGQRQGRRYCRRGIGSRADRRLREVLDNYYLSRLPCWIGPAMPIWSASSFCLISKWLSLQAAACR